MSSSWTPMPYFCGGGTFFKRIIQGALVAFCLFALAGCGMNDSGKSRNSPKAPPPPTADASGAGGALPSMQPAKGLNPAHLFDEPLNDPEQRISRLETAVQSLRNDFDSVSPSIKRLSGLENEIQDLISQLEKLVQQKQAAPAPATAYQPPMALQPEEMDEEPIQSAAPPPAPQAAAKPAPSAAGGNAQVYDVRVGEHPGKTRLVLDMSAKASFSADVDNAEKILVVDLPEAGWTAAQSKSFSSSPILASYRVEPSSTGGHLMIVTLKTTANIVYKSGMEDGGHFKIVIDLAKGDSVGTN